MRHVWLGLVCGCAGDPVPDCVDLRHSPIDIDLTGAVPVFSWDGDAPQGFAVLDAVGGAQWELLCTCPAGSCDDADAWAARACVPSPLTYGEVPDVARLDATAQLEALPLDAGATYTALIWSDCDANGPSTVLRSGDFFP